MDDRLNPSPGGPLSGISIVECGQGVSASFAAKMLADLGAGVVKVEPPDGDITRRRGPFPSGIRDPERSGLFQYLNSNKRGVVLDLGLETDRQRLDNLLAGSDILIHNVPPADQASQGLEAAEIAAAHPNLIITQISIFGAGGPRSHYRGYELQAFHSGGAASLTPHGEPSPVLPPLKFYGHQAEFQAAAHAAFVTLAAYWNRLRTGLGQAIDISTQECLTAFFELAFINYTYTGKRNTRDTPKSVSPWNIMRTGDGYIYFCCGEQDQWLRLVELMGNPPWAHDDRFRDGQHRGKHSKALRALMEEWARNWSFQELYRECVKHRIPAAPLNRMSDLYHDEDLIERGFFVELPSRSNEQPVRVPGAPFKSTADGWSLRSPAPHLGEHNAEVFARSKAAEKPGAGRRAAALKKEEKPPLSGVRVLDFSWIWAGPYATLQLAHLGAEVIRVESAKRPCLNRRLPPYADGVPGFDRAGSFCQWNQGKRSLLLDLSNARAIEIAHQLIPHCDIVVENFAPGVAERMGLGYRQLRELRSDLIMLSISGYGQTGSRRHLPSYGNLSTAAAGFNSVLGYESGDARELGITWADPVAGLFGAYAMVAALIHRQRSGHGQYIDLSMLEMLLTTMPEALLEYEIAGREPQAMGNHDPCMSPHNCYKASGDDESWVTIAAGSEEEWRSLCRAIGQPSLAEDSRFATFESRKQHESELDQIITQWTSRQERWEITELLQKAGVAALPTMSNQDLAEDPHLMARGFMVELEHPVVGRRRHAGVPWHMWPSVCKVQKPAPLLGADTEDILHSLLGYSKEQITRLRQEQVLY